MYIHGIVYGDYFLLQFNELNLFYQNEAVSVSIFPYLSLSLTVLGADCNLSWHYYLLSDTLYEPT